MDRGAVGPGQYFHDHAAGAPCAPYRGRAQKRVNDYFVLLATFPHLEWAAPTIAIADRAAQLRAELQFRTPDAVQAATALVGQAEGFISNDKAFRRMSGIDVLILEDLSAQ